MVVCVRRAADPDSLLALAMSGWSSGSIVNVISLVARWAGLVLFVLCVLTGISAASFEEERQLGRQFDLAARQQIPLITDPEVVGYVDAIGQKIAAKLDDSFFEYRFAVVRDGHINAFAVPGGYIYVHSGLLIRASNDDEVAGVLAHEIAHIHARHMMRQRDASKLMNYTALLGMLLTVVNPALGALASGLSAANSLSYQREFEQEADYLGVRYLVDTGYDSRALLDFFKKLSDQSRLQPTFAPAYLLSHPLTDERLNHLEAILRTQQWASHERPPKSFELHRVQVLARARTEPPIEVMQAYRRLIEEHPSDPLAHYLFGVASLETGQVEDARQALEKAQAGGIQQAQRGLGRVALRQRDVAKARQLLGHHVERQPDDATAYVELAKAHVSLGESEQAMEAYRHAIAVQPKLASAHYGFAMIAGRAGDKANGFYHLATASRLNGEYAKALSQYTQAQELLPPRDRRRTEVEERIAELTGFLETSDPHGRR